MIDEKIKKEQKERRKEGEIGDESEAKGRQKEKHPPEERCPRLSRDPAVTGPMSLDKGRHCRGSYEPQSAGRRGCIGLTFTESACCSHHMELRGRRDKVRAGW